MELYCLFFLTHFFSNLYRKMPQALSDGWRHFTAANVEGKAAYIWKYCAKSWRMWRMQQRCRIKFPHRSQQATSDKVPLLLFEVKMMNQRPYRWQQLIQVCLTQRRNVVREMLMMSCSSCVSNWFTSDAHRHCVLGEISVCSLTSIHPSNQTCFIC